MSQGNVEVVRRTLETFERDRTKASYEGLIADDVELRPAFELTGGTSFSGPEGVVRFTQQWTEAFDDWTLRTDELLDLGDIVVASLSQSARGKGSGVPVENRFGAVFRLRDGLITHMELYMTKAEALKVARLEE